MAELYSTHLALTRLGAGGCHVHTAEINWKHLPSQAAHSPRVASLLLLIAAILPFGFSRAVASPARDVLSKLKLKIGAEHYSSKFRYHTIAVCSQNGYIDILPRLGFGDVRIKFVAWAPPRVSVQ